MTGRGKENDIFSPSPSRRSVSLSGWIFCMFHPDFFNQVLEEFTEMRGSFRSGVAVDFGRQKSDEVCFPFIALTVPSFGR